MPLAGMLLLNTNELMRGRRRVVFGEKDALIGVSVVLSPFVRQGAWGGKREEKVKDVAKNAHTHRQPKNTWNQRVARKMRADDL